MINVGFKLTAKDLRKLAEFKHSIAYGTYLKSIKSSPAYVAIMKEHADKIDIEEDVTKLKSEGKLPDSIPSDALTALFKQSIARMVINIVADTTILKELEDRSTDEVIHDIKEDVNILYLTGMAEPKYYKEAQKLLEDGKLDKDDVAYRGLMAWMKRQDKDIPDVKLTSVDVEPKTPVIPKTKKPRELDLDSLNIDLGE